MRYNIEAFVGARAASSSSKVTNIKHYEQSQEKETPNLSFANEDFVVQPYRSEFQFEGPQLFTHTAKSNYYCCERDMDPQAIGLTNDAVFDVKLHRHEVHYS